jgi:hypothetical protein
MSTPDSAMIMICICYFPCPCFVYAEQGVQGRLAPVYA